MSDKLEFNEELTSGEESFDYEKVFKECFVDLSEVIERPPVALSIGTRQYKDKFYPLEVHTYGEFSATVAPSKTKKTFYKTALIASYIGGNCNTFFPNIKTHRDSDYYIVDIDTEQGSYYAQHAFRRVVEMTGSVYENYMPFAMRSKTPKERVMFVDALMNDPKYKGRIKFVSIDGIADMIENTNDILMSAEIAGKVLKWTNEGIHFHTIIHKLMNTEKPTGHLGSYILKKAETVVFLEKEDPNDRNSNILVKQKYSRGMTFDDFAFNVNENGLPYLVDSFVTNNFESLL